MLAIVGALWPLPIAAQAPAGAAFPSLDFSRFVPYEYSFVLYDGTGTGRETISYRIVEEQGARVLERRSVAEFAEGTAIPRTTFRRTIESRSLLPDLRPLSTRVVTHAWEDSLAAWSTDRVEVEFRGDSVRRVLAGRTMTRPLPAGARQWELTGTVFAYAAGEQPLSGARITVYDALADQVREVGWTVRGEETVTALGRPYRALAVTVGADTGMVSFYLADRPRILLTTRPVGAPTGSGREYRLVRWCSRPTAGQPCLSSYPDGEGARN